MLWFGFQFDASTCPVGLCVKRIMLLLEVKFLTLNHSHGAGTALS